MRLFGNRVWGCWWSSAPNFSPILNTEKFSLDLKYSQDSAVQLNRLRFSLLRSLLFVQNLFYTKNGKSELCVLKELNAVREYKNRTLWSCNIESWLHYKSSPKFLALKMGAKYGTEGHRHPHTWFPDSLNIYSYNFYCEVIYIGRIFSGNFSRIHSTFSKTGWSKAK